MIFMNINTFVCREINTPNHHPNIKTDQIDKNTIYFTCYPIQFLSFMQDNHSYLCIADYITVLQLYSLGISNV